MSVLVKNMKMPEYGCKDCILVKRGSVYDICLLLRVPVDDDVEFGGSPSNCPLISIPPHGRLIDADALHIDLIDRGIADIQTNDWYEMRQAVDDAPTIIESEGEE